MERAVIYARFSSAGQREESIEGQVRDCTEYAKRNGMTVVHIYADRALSGTTDKRPEFQRMIRDSAKHTFNVVLCWKMDRFARNRYDSALYKAKLKANNVHIEYAKEALPDGPEAIILESLMEGMAEYYSANLSQNVKRGLYDSAMHRGTIGQTCYGLRKGEDGRFEIDEAVAPIIQRIFNDYAAGRKATDIVAELNAEGHRTRTGGVWTKNGLRQILTNPKYKGLYVYADIYDEDGIPAIVPKETWDKVQSMMEEHHKKPSAKRFDEDGWLLSGKLFCGHCKRRMQSSSGKSCTGKLYRYYQCIGNKEHVCDKHRAPKDEVEDLIVWKIAEIIQDDDMIAEIASRFIKWQAKQKKENPSSDIEARLRETEKAEENILKALETGAAAAVLTKRLEQLESERKELAEALAIQKATEPPEITYEEVQFFLENFRNGDVQEHRWRVHLVNTFLQAAYLYDDGRLILSLNITGSKGTVETKDVSLSDISSFFARPSPPRCAKSNYRIVIVDSSAFVLTTIPGM